MKVNLVGKLKWYIIGFILIAIMLSVSLSFCSWDNFNYKSYLSSGYSGNYKEVISLEVDNDNNKIISVGDIVSYGSFYQNADAYYTQKMDNLRWLVVDYNQTSKVATLLTEKVIIFGSVWGELWKRHYQNYYQSTVRSWLNSGKGSLLGEGNNWDDNLRMNDNVRNDGIGSLFGIEQSSQVNRGFLDVAFTSVEKNILVPKKMSGMYAAEKNTSTLVECKSTESKNFINDLVWVPSYKEIFGAESSYGYPVLDGTSVSDQFQYFVGKIDNSNVNPISSSLICGATGYAWDSSKTSYYNNGAGGLSGDINAVIWWLRSSMPINISPIDMLGVSLDGSVSPGNSADNYRGVRPAVCVQL